MYGTQETTVTRETGRESIEIIYIIYLVYKYKFSILLNSNLVICKINGLLEKAKTTGRLFEVQH